MCKESEINYKKNIENKINETEKKFDVNLREDLRYLWRYAERERRRCPES